RDTTGKSKQERRLPRGAPTAVARHARQGRDESRANRLGRDAHGKAGTKVAPAAFGATHTARQGRKSRQPPWARRTRQGKDESRASRLARDAHGKAGTKVAPWARHARKRKARTTV